MNTTDFFRKAAVAFTAAALITAPNAVLAQQPSAPSTGSPEIDTPEAITVNPEQSAVAQKVVVTAISPNDLVQLMQTLGFRSGATINDGVPIVAAKLPDEQGGAGFIILMAGCSSTACQAINPISVFRADGMTLAQANQLNRSKLANSSVLFRDTGTAYVSSNIYLPGGVTVDNLAFQIAMFVNDLDTVLKSVTPGVLASVDLEDETLKTINFKQLDTGALAEKIANVSDLQQIIETGANAPTVMTPELVKILEK